MQDLKSYLNLFHCLWNKSQNIQCQAVNAFITRARNNSRSTDNVRTDWGVDRSTSRLAGLVDWSHLIVLKMK